jgi:hypothetical protein
MLKEELLQIYAQVVGPDTYTATLDPPHLFVEGDFITLRFQHGNASPATFVPNSVSYPIAKSDGSPTAGGEITDDMIATLEFDGTNFRMPAAGGGGGGGSNVHVNGGGTLANPNFNGTTPAAPGGGLNITWQSSGSSVSAYIPAGTYDASGAAAAAQTAAENFATSADTTVLSTAEGYTDAQIAARAVLFSPTGDQTITAHNLSLTGASAVLAAPIINATTGFEISGAAAAGHYLRGDGSHYIDSAIQAGDIPSLPYLLLTGGTLTGDLLFSTDNSHDVGASGATRPRTVYVGTSVLAPLFNAATGFQIAGAAASGHYLRGNGTDYIDGTIQAGDVPSLPYLLLTGGTLTGDLLFSTDDIHDIGASGATRPRTIYAGTSVLAPLFNAATGFQIAGAAASGHYLRGNGTDYIDGTIQVGDVPSLPYLLLTGGTLTGDLLFSTDNTHDIGATGATRPRTLYIGTSAVVPELDVDTIKLDSANKDVILIRDGAADILALQRTTHAQTLRIYGTTSGPKYLSLRHDGTDGIVDSVGGGILKLEIGGVAKWQIDTSGDLLATTDNSYDIGAVAATRPRTIYAGTSVLAPLFNASTGFQIGGAAAVAGHVLRANGTDYVDSALSFSDLAVATTDITFSTAAAQKLTNVHDPTAAQDVATKNYVDNSFVSGNMNAGVRKVTAGSTDTILTTDRAKLVSYNNAAYAVTVPSAATLANPTTWYVYIENIGTGNVTFTPTTSTIDGQTSFVLTPGTGVALFSDGTNYFTERGTPPSANTVTTTNDSYTAGQRRTYDLTIAKSFLAFNIAEATGKKFRLQLYATSAARTADASRPFTIPLALGTQHKCILDLYIEQNLAVTPFTLSPAVLGSNDDGTRASTIYAAVTSLEAATQSIQVTISCVKLET